MASEQLITLPYSPRHVFLPFHDSDRRWSVVVAHRRAGKTVAMINHLIRAAALCEREEGRYAYIAPLFNQAKDVAWAYLKRFAGPILAREPNETELRVDLINGSRIRLYGADNPDRLRGLYLDGVVLDEYADMHPAVWGEVIRPLLADRQGWAAFIGTPKGRNAFWEIWDRGTSKPEWFALMLRASETGLLPPGELEAARRDMTPEQYEQEFECSFEAAILGAYYGKEIAEAERSGRIGAVPVDRNVKVQTAWDLGVRDSTAIWFFQVVESEVHVIDYYESHSQALSHYDAVIRSKGYDIEADWLPHDAKARELGTNRTLVETLMALKRRPRIVPMHEVLDGVNAGRLTIARCWFDADNCKQGLEALRQYRADYDDKTRAFKNAPKHDWTSHAADAFRYLAMAYRKIKPKVEAPKPRHVWVGQEEGSIRSTLTVRQMIERQAKRREADD